MQRILIIGGNTRRNRRKYCALLQDAPHVRQLVFRSPRWLSTLPTAKEDNDES